MAINFPDSPTNTQEVTEGNVTYVYNATKGYWESSEVSSGASIDVLADMAALIAKTGMSNGDQAFVTGNNNLYIYSGSGWYKVATVQNDAPSAITGVNGTYELAIDGTATTITAVSTDPEGFPLTWSYSTSGLGSIATVSQTENVFTITPSTTEADAGTFSLTINATDGVNGAVSTSTNLTLDFIVTVTNSKYTTLLATATGTSDNNNITDASSNNHSITVSGDAYAGTFSPYRSGGYSTYFDGTGDYLSISSNASLNFDYSAFTVECWVKSSVKINFQTVVAKYNQSDTTGLFILLDSSGNLLFGTNPSNYITSSGTDICDGAWHHISCTRSVSSGVGTMTMYIDGSSAGTLNRLDNVYNVVDFEIGRQNAVGRVLTGYVSDLRVVKGTAITPPSGGPTERLEAVTNTSLLTCHLPYIADGSTNDHSITVNGNTSTKPFSPYDYNEYSATDHGGSMLFDGTGDALRIADNSNIQLGTSPFTIEGWFYCTDTTPTQGILAKRDASGEYWRWIITGGNLNFRFQSVGGGSFSFNTVSVPANTWCHFAVTRDSNNDVRQFVNGIETTNNINSTGNFDISGSTLRVGEYELNTGHFNGFVSDIKIVKNSALYTSDFTPPTAPLSSSGTTLHIQGTDASIIDKSQGSNLKLVGNTTGSTTQVKFAGSKSMYFDGSGDYILTPTSDFFNYGTDDFTMECWVYIPSNPSNYSYLFAQGNSVNGTNSIGVYIQSGVFKIWNGVNIFTGTTSYSLNTWTHIAISRSGNSLKLYINGNQEGSSVTNTSNISTGSSNGIEIARWIGISDPEHFTGYIQDLRITKGLARYTTNFTPPTASLEG